MTTRRPGLPASGVARLLGLLVAVLVVALTAAVALVPASAAPRSGDPGGWTVVRAESPARTLVKDRRGRLRATFTDGSRTVVVAGPRRTFAEPATTSATVTTTSWVRLLPQPFAGTVDRRWLRATLQDRSPDLLAVALAYRAGEPEVRDAGGALLSGDASYGPLLPDGSRQEGADWNDHLGVTATYDGVVDRPERDQRGALDCSGFVRAVFGHRGGYPMTLTPDGVRLPRRAVHMATAGPGTEVVPDSGGQVTRFDRMLAGDLVLFDVAADDGPDVDHVGIYLGRDDSGRPRFLSSRKKADGPTIGDVGGRSVLDGKGTYARGFRAVRRL